MTGTPSSAPIIDCHVHLVGNGRRGSGCWIRMSGWHRWLGGFMAKMIGMPVGFEHDDFDAAYVAKLATSVKESSVDQILLLAQEEVYNEDGSKREFGSFHVPNDYLFEVCAGNPAFLPAVSIHPARKDALEELDRCLAKGARALKLLPNCLDVDCSRPAYDAFWEKMAESGLPMLAHTGGEMTVPVANKLYQDPRYLERPLEIGVKIIAAHAASNSSLWDEDYFDVLVEMMHRHPNLYGDSSALNTPVRSSAFGKILRSEMADRFIHGSDFPVPVGTWYARLRGLVDAKSRAEAARTPNLIERDYLLKRAMSFPDRHFTRVADILRKVD